MPNEDAERLRAAAHERTARTVQRAQQTLAEARTDRRAMSVAAFCQRAGVSRAWLYTQPDLLTQLRAITGPPQATRRTRENASSPSLLNRLRLAHQRIDKLTAENRSLRDELARAYGQLRAARAGEPAAAPILAPIDAATAAEIGRC